MVTRVSGAVPSFFTIIVGFKKVPVRISPKAMSTGATDISGSTPVPLRFTVTVSSSGSLELMVNDPV
jgi:hypothetical protein